MNSTFGDTCFRSVLAIAIALVVCLLFLGLSDPYDGFHGFQEAWYAAIAENYSSHSLFLPTTYNEILDLNVPPFFSHLVYLSFSLFGSSEAAARIVPVLFSLISLAGVHLLAEMLSRRRAGLEAAALFAATPMFLILGRNVQTDIVFVCLSLFFIYFYLRGRESGHGISFVVAGCFLGLSILTKQFAVIPAVAIVVWELFGPDRKKLVGKNFLVMAAVAGVIIAPYYGYHLLRDPVRLISAQLHGSASKAGMATGPRFSFLMSELFWGISPLIFLGAAAGLGISLVRMNRKKALAALGAAFFFVFYLFFHRHSYYAFGMVPFLVICFTCLSERLPQKMYRCILLISIFSGICLSAYQSFGSNHGGGEMKQVGEYLKQYQSPAVFANKRFILNYEPLFKYYAKNATLLRRRSRQRPNEMESIRQSDAIFALSDVPSGAGAIPIKGRVIGVRFGGRCFIHNPPNIHFFAPNPPTEIKDGAVVRSFGPFVLVERTSFLLVQQKDLV